MEGRGNYRSVERTSGGKDVTDTGPGSHLNETKEDSETLAKIEPKLALKTQAHHIDVSWLHEAYRRTRKDGAAGVDGVDAAQYEAHLKESLED